MGITFTQGCDRCVFRIPTASFEPLEDQNAMALVLANSSADRLQSFPQGAGGFPFAFTGVNLDAACRDKRQRCVAVYLWASMSAHFRVKICDLY